MTIATKKSHDGFFWSLFSSGGMLAAMLIPIHVFIFWVAAPHGWLTPNYDHLRSLAQMPLVRLYLFVLCSLSLFHWAHRFRFTLYDGLQIKHLNELVFVCCYGTALAGTIVAAYLLSTF